MTMESWGSYPKIYHVGHRYLDGIFNESVIVEEKIDGSQFSFGIYTETDEFIPALASIRCRSKGAEINLVAPEKMFSKAIETVKELSPILHPGWTYRAEYLQKPKHNVLAYDRIPNKHLILFDVSTGTERFLSRAEKEAEAKRIGLEIVPIIFEGVISSPEIFRDFMDTISVLGGQKVEGVVVKNYERFGIDGKPLFGKFVSEAFKEVHNNDWKERNPKQGDIVTNLIEKYRTPARWQKAVQHLKEAGALENSPRDIGKLIAEAGKDLEVEEMEAIKELLWKWAWPQIRRGMTHGLPEFYKELLLKSAFEVENESV